MINPHTLANSTSGAKKTRIALKNGVILTHPGISPVEQHKFTVFDDHVLSLVNSEPNQDIEFDEIVDCAGCLIMPGLVNCHNHTPMSLLRGLSDDLPLEKWLRNYIFPLEAKFVCPDFVYTGAQLSMIEMLLSGTTTLADAYFFMESAANAAIDVGIRAVVAQGIVDIETPDTVGENSWLERVEKFLANFPSNPLTQPALFCHSPYLCDDKTFVKAQSIATEKNMLLFSHVSETRSEVKNSIALHGLRPFEWLSQNEILNKNFVAVHAVHVNDHERELIKESSVGIVHCPRSNMKLSSGLAHVRKFLEYGISFGLGTDGPASNNNLDLIEEMRAAAFISKVVDLDSDAIGAQEVLYAATLGGAGILGMEKLIGSLEAGKYADVIVLDLDSPHLVPPYNPHSLIVYSAKGSDVRDVFVHGKHVVSKGKITTLDLDIVQKGVSRLSYDIAKTSGGNFWGKC